jgi:hypothetical protein
LLFDCTVVPPQKYSSGKKKCNLLADIRGDIGFLFGESVVLLNRFPCRRQARTAVPNTLLGTWETETEILYSIDKINKRQVANQRIGGLLAIAG